ncbi:pilus assembly protein TadG-related protein [Thalassotalea fonticola]|uniref:Pilus assembly protein TadG-related protein n=1 Tax=Thalassotalea fonticola TaxID=3065649 RepID=A0ABZ0GUX5_9GAMM|nr:pilus assembly protein TadG-related protein [Colwelliaceae bacterium S1-1]
MKQLVIFKQKGNILIMFTIGLFALIGLSALALDGGHLLLNNNRLQNYADASALNAAKTLDENKGHDEARLAVVKMLRRNLAHNDAAEILAALDVTDSAVTTTSNQITPQLLVEFSLLPDPFISTTEANARFVRVQISDLNLSNFLANIFNFDKTISVTALAGPSTAITYCFNDLVPMMVCGTPKDEIPAGLDPDLFGFEVGNLEVMKMDSNPDSQIGPGNFQLIKFEGSNGADDIRDAMAGGNDGAGEMCFNTPSEDPDLVSDSEVPTETGNTVGPVAQGLNTRLGEYDGPMNQNRYLYPRDPNACQGKRIELDDFGTPYVEVDGVAVPIDTLDGDGNSLFYPEIYTHNNYVADNSLLSPSCTDNETGDWDADPSDTIAVPGRRIIRIVVGECTGDANGSNTVDFLGVGCFFLTQETAQKGNESYVVGEFIENCTGNGWPSGDAEANGPHTLVLYHVPGSSDS